MRKYNMHEAKTRLSELAQKSLETGEVFIISRYDKPILRVVPIMSGFDADKDMKPVLKEFVKQLAELNSREHVFERDKMDKERELIERAETIFSDGIAEVENSEEFWDSFKEKYFEDGKVDSKIRKELDTVVSNALCQIRIGCEFGLYLTRVAKSYLKTLEGSVSFKEVIEIAKDA